jgi:hypothetical protein
MNDLLIKLGLASSNFSPLHDKWEEFEGEFNL